MLKADLHIHTKYSYDGNLSPADILKKANQIGLDVIGITDHGTRRGGLEVSRLNKNKKLIVLVGQETKTIQGEILVYNIGFDLPENQDIIKTCETAKKNSGFIILPHPFDFIRKAVKNPAKILKYVDAVEGFNARCLLNYFNKKARDFAKKNNKPVTSGSDAHFIQEIGTAVTLIDSDRNQKSILNTIKKGKTMTAGKKSGLRPHIQTFLLKFKKLVT